MGKNKEIIILDPIKDKICLQMLNDMVHEQVSKLEYGNNKDLWTKTSRKIGRIAKPLIELEDPLIYPASTSRYHNIGFWARPKNVNVKITPFGKKRKVVLSRKIF